LSGAYSTTGGSLSGIWHGGARWAVTAALNAQMSTQFASTGGTMSVRYAW
jgi:hypothetical protein